MSPRMLLNPVHWSQALTEVEGPGAKPYKMVEEAAELLGNWQICISPMALTDSRPRFVGACAAQPF